KGLIITSLILMAFAAVPGFPPVIFAGLALVVGGGGLVKLRAEKRGAKKRHSSQMPAFGSAVSAEGEHPILSQTDDEERDQPVGFSITLPLIIDMSTSVRNSIRPEELDREVARMRRALYLDLGVPFPTTHLRLNNSLADGEYR